MMVVSMTAETLRAVETIDFGDRNTSAPAVHDLFGRVSNRIINEVNGISRGGDISVVNHRLPLSGE